MLKNIIKTTLIDSYNETNDINEACKIVESEFPKIKTTIIANDDHYKIDLYSPINNNYITTIKI